MSIKALLIDLDAVESRLQELDYMAEHTPQQAREVQALETRQAELLSEINTHRKSA